MKKKLITIIGLLVVVAALILVTRIPVKNTLRDALEKSVAASTVIQHTHFDYAFETIDNTLTQTDTITYIREEYRDEDDFWNRYVESEWEAYFTNDRKDITFKLHQFDATADRNIYPLSGLLLGETFVSKNYSELIQRQNPFYFLDQSNIEPFQHNELLLDYLNKDKVLDLIENSSVTYNIFTGKYTLRVNTEYLEELIEQDEERISQLEIIKEIDIAFDIENGMVSQIIINEKSNFLKDLPYYSRKRGMQYVYLYEETDERVQQSYLEFASNAKPLEDLDNKLSERVDTVRDKMYIGDKDAEIVLTMYIKPQCLTGECINFMDTEFLELVKELSEGEKKRINVVILKQSISANMLGCTLEQTDIQLEEFIQYLYEGSAKFRDDAIREFGLPITEYYPATFYDDLSNTNYSTLVNAFPGIITAELKSCLESEIFNDLSYSVSTSGQKNPFPFNKLDGEIAFALVNESTGEILDWVF